MSKFEIISPEVYNLPRPETFPYVRPKIRNLRLEFYEGKFLKGTMLRHPNGYYYKVCSFPKKSTFKVLISKLSFGIYEAPWYVYLEVPNYFWRRDA